MEVGRGPLAQLATGKSAAESVRRFWGALLASNALACPIARPCGMRRRRLAGRFDKIQLAGKARLNGRSHRARKIIRARNSAQSGCHTISQAPLQRLQCAGRSNVLASSHSCDSLLHCAVTCEMMSSDSQREHTGVDRTA